VHVLQADLAAAQAKADAHGQADAGRRARGVMARIMAAWRGG
jgi:hypothetical protein